MFIKSIIFVCLFLSFSAQAKLIISTLPEFSWIVKELVPSEKSESLLNGGEDPHFVDASPSFVFKVAKADIVISNGLELEIGWLPKVLQLSGNSKVQLGESGFCDASQDVEKIEVNSSYTRAMGDVHPLGNPHYSLSPKRMMDAAKSIKSCLEKSIKSQSLEVNYKKLIEKLNSLSKYIETNLKPKKVYVYHREFNYLAKDYKLTVLRSLEEVPGVLPSMSYLSKLTLLSKEDKPEIVLASLTSSKRILNKFEELSGVSNLSLRLHPSPNTDYESFIKDIVKKINND